ncbi:MAG: glycine--tRNA ligase subunit beta [Pseudomonadota bacterium]|nr:glycine--tRNA ligase subunit beta [Pseudomonadota bacterium]
MAELLLELFSEEIPARMQKRASEDLKRLVTDGLKSASLEFSSAEAYVTPRRLVLVVDGLPERQPDISDEKRGPRIDAPEKAVQGFLRGNGLTLDQCEQRETEKGKFWYAVIESKGRATAEVLPGVVGDAVSGMAWQKSMRWGEGSMRWVRSLQRVLCLFDGAVLGLTVGDGIAAGNVTSGHRFHAVEAFEVANFADYRDKLRAAHVIIDAAERRDIIEKGAAKLAQAEGLTVAEDPALLDEVSGLVEWPVPLIGTIDDDFMTVPGEALTSAMRNHQKFFSLQNADGSLASRFVVVANLDAPDGGTQITAGNERVLRARLSDARFFWDQDRKTRLEERVPALDKIVFHARLGTLGEKITRVQTLAIELSGPVKCDPDMARVAALLSKADLVTEMVAEFPELQGIMGRYYAQGEGEKPEIAQAIAEHYAPQGPNDTCPTAPVSVAVALADKIDTLVGFWAIGETPTGSRDPFALRRAALGVIRLVIENDLRISLTKILITAYQIYIREYSRYKTIALYNEKGFQGTSQTYMFTDDDEKFENLILKHKYDFVTVTKPGEALTISGGGKPPSENSLQSKFLPVFEQVSSLLDFFADRLKVYLRDQGVRYDHINAIFPTRMADEEYPSGVDLVRIMARVDALQDFLKSDDGNNLLIAYRRASNIVRIEEEKDGESYSASNYKPELAEHEEHELWLRLEKTIGFTSSLIETENFDEAMAALADLRNPIDVFFENVQVNTDSEKLRANRLSLLSHIKWAMDNVADFSKIEG